MNELDKIKKKQKEKIDYLLSIGFKPISDDPENTLYKRDGYVIPASLKRSIDDIKRELKEALGEDYEVRHNVASETKPEDKVEAEVVEPLGAADAQPESEPNPFKDNSEPVEPFFVAEMVKSIETPVFRRLTLDGNRYYYRLLDDGTVRIYASGTNLIKDGYAEVKDQLYTWKKGLELIGQNPEEVSQYEADKGTIMHYLFGLYLTGRDIYLRRSHIIQLVEESDLRIPKKNIDRFKSSEEDLDNMIERIRRFAKFCSDYKVKPILIEKILSHEKYCVASPIDLVCQMTVVEKVEGYFGATYKVNGKGFKAGDPKLEKKDVERTFNAIVDFKSGGIYPAYALQLELYRREIEEWYGDVLPIEKLYNFSPKSESSRGYTLRDQTNNKEIKKADCVFAQGAINHENKDKVYKTYVGKININEDYNEDSHIKIYDIATELANTFE